MAGKFEIKKRPGGQYHFVLKAANGQIIATSETTRRSRRRRTASTR
jgi:uncharacterized protein YegP (UPF0339 family)